MQGRESSRTGLGSTGSDIVHYFYLGKKNNALYCNICAHIQKHIARQCSQLLFGCMCDCHALPTGMKSWTQNQLFSVLSTGRGKHKIFHV